MFQFVMALSMLRQKKISEYNQHHLIVHRTPLDCSKRQIAAFCGLLEFSIIDRRHCNARRAVPSLSKQWWIVLWTRSSPYWRYVIAQSLRRYLKRDRLDILMVAVFMFIDYKTR